MNSYPFGKLKGTECTTRRGSFIIRHRSNPGTNSFLFFWECLRREALVVHTRRSLLPFLSCDVLPPSASPSVLPSSLEVPREDRSNEEPLLQMPGCRMATSRAIIQTTILFTHISIHCLHHQPNGFVFLEHLA